MNHDIQFMKVAINEAIVALYKNEVPIGAAITYQNVVIAKTHNLTQTFQNITAHAEMLAINLASSHLGVKYIKKCTLYVTIVPCIMCAGALFWSKIGKVVCGANNHSKIGFLNYGIKLHPKTKFIFGIMEEQCQYLIQKFFFIRRIQKKMFK
ncbi:nucleoside deaminase [Blattabacterium cuenoti]|uniref:nucleoside deaminase n=1 Tax=Blattabacterium cuenoti TaxID=1653831 RepID=UPI00163C7A41|nr:nucleoside deaminase [Blattabacterium cuenoti]